MFRELWDTLKIVFVLMIVLISGLTLGYLGGTAKERKDMCSILEQRAAGDVHQDFIDFSICEGQLLELPEYIKIP